MEKLFIKGTIAGAGDFKDGDKETVFTYRDLENFLNSRSGSGPFLAVIDSPGGSVDEGFKIYSRLKEEGADTLAIRANSIASVIFAAGKKRYVSPAAEIIIHNAWVDPGDLSGEKLNFHSAKMLVDYFAETDAKILGVYTEHTGEDKAGELLAYMAVDKNLGADKALELGLATEQTEEEEKAQNIARKVLTFSKNFLDLLNVQDGPVTTYADVMAFKGGNLLVMRRKDSDEFEPGTWALPGGKVMQGETTEDGAAREFEEETGIKAESLIRLGEEVNGDESVSHYFAAVIAEDPKETPEHDSWQYVSAEELKGLKIIKGENERFIKYFTEANQISMKTEEKIGAFEKLLKGLAKAFKLNAKNMTVTTTEGVELYISGEGELVGSAAFIAEEGLPTETPAPAGPHTLSDGTQITVGEGGVITEAVEPQNSDEIIAKYEEEKQALEQEKKELEAKVVALTAEAEENKKNFAEIQKAFASLKNEVLGDPQKKEEPKKMSAEEFKKLSPMEKIRMAALNKASN